MIFFLCKDVTFLVLWKELELMARTQPLVNLPTSWTLLVRLPYSPVTSIVAHSFIVSDSLWSHGLQHARLPCPSPSPRVCSNSCSLSQWCRPTISCSCCPLFFLPSTFLSITVFDSESVLRIRWPRYWSFNLSPSNEYSWLISFRIDWFDHSKKLSRVFSNTIVWKHQFFSTQPSLWSNSNNHTWLLEKPWLDYTELYWTLVCSVTRAIMITGKDGQHSLSAKAFKN